MRLQSIKTNTARTTPHKLTMVLTRNKKTNEGGGSIENRIHTKNDDTLSPTRGNHGTEGASKNNGPPPRPSKNQPRRGGVGDSCHHKESTSNKEVDEKVAGEAGAPASSDAGAGASASSVPEEGAGASDDAGAGATTEATASDVSGTDASSAIVTSKETQEAGETNGVLVEEISVSTATTLSSLGGTTTLASSTTSVKKLVNARTPAEVSDWLWTGKVPDDMEDIRRLTNVMGGYIRELHSQIMAMSDNMVYLADIPRSGARQRGKSKAVVELSKSNHTLKGLISRCIEGQVWRKRAFFLKEGWHLYSTNDHSFCQLFMKWGKLRDVKPEYYGGEEVLWDRFVVPLLSQLMMAKRANLYRKVQEWWGGKCMSWVKIYVNNYFVL